MRRLLFNIMVSGFGMFLAGAISLVVLPFVLNTYGAYEFGLFMAARLLLPSGVFNILDFGIGSAIPRIVAGARRRRHRSHARSLVTFATLTLAGIGTLLGLGIIIFDGLTARFFNVDGGSEEAFRLCLILVAVSLPVGFPGLAFRAVLEGTERQVAVRGIEVAVAILQSSAIFACTRLELPFWSCVAVSAAADVARSFGFFVAVQATGFHIPHIHRRPRAAAARLSRIWRQFGLMKIYSGGAEQGARLLVARILGPEALGLWELAWRLPAFIKLAVSSANVAIYPYLLRLAVKNRRRTIRRSMTVGQDLYFLLFAPLHAALVIGAGPFALLWVGEEALKLGDAIALAFFVNVLTLFVYVPTMVGTLELRILPALAKINLIQAIAYIVVLVPALHMLGVTGGVGARVISFLIYIVVQNWLLSRIVGFKFRSSIWPGARMLLACLAVGALYHAYVFPLFPLSVTWFLFYFAGLALVSYGVAIFCLGRLARRALAVLGRRFIKGLNQAGMRRHAG